MPDNSYEDNLLRNHALLRKEQETQQSRLTKFGQNHGGGARLTWHMTIAKFVAFMGAFAIAVPLGNSDWSINAKTAILVGYVSFFVLFDLVALFLYVRFKYAMLFVAVLVVFIGIAAGMMALLFSILP